MQLILVSPAEPSSVQLSPAHFGIAQAAPADPSANGARADEQASHPFVERKQRLPLMTLIRGVSEPPRS
eukprot:6088047-Pyramimonas_sp.AAC.1